MPVYINNATKLSLIFVLYVITPCLLIAQEASLAPKNEMRGVWVATVANIDWPSQPGLKVKEQKAEALQIIRHSKQLGLNAIFLQVRPASDVLYKSVYEPWSKVLTGEAGKSPKYDPLKYWIELAHADGLELHAWINPYRASMNMRDELPAKHPYHDTPEMFVEYGNKLYFNPGHPDANTHINKVVKELVENYAIDGIHMDDYFYPYPVSGQVFPDSMYYERYGQMQFDDIADWRRENVNQTIRSIQATIQSTKPWVQFGISPFGVWRNKTDDPLGSDTKAGTTNYDGLYADVLKWMQNGWIDYVVPQLYWGTSHPVANYLVLVNWWNENSCGLPVYIGHGIYKIGSDKADWQDVQQLPSQLGLVRSSSNLNGSVFFSYKHLKRDLLGLQDSLINNFYQTKALAIYGANSQSAALAGDVEKLKATRRKIKWKSTNNDNAAPEKYIIYRYQAFDAFSPDDARFILDVVYDTKYRIPKRTNGFVRQYIIRVAALGAGNTEGTLSEPLVVEF
ncbi:family 10 glycosylhydrolase [Carboxylicivirga mesophila]|uniref:Family 10 glycosylhydrolase n=1 Tax=Carboxylicivirga mesophila TaxID=1166478 RepID=A0ABS5KDU4_9BACT|nr:family 10 glycosylhydrolase [Carboxylicivirga mesophila]MBS2212972.1 family 10 glycosylhydrolase [Carboxylicivirga mesophila]